MTQQHSEHSVVVRLAGRAAEIVDTVEVKVPGNTPREIIARLAEANPALRDLMIKRDGTPTSFVRVLLEGQVQDLDAPIADQLKPSAAATLMRRIIIIVFLPCDG